MVLNQYDGIHLSASIHTAVETFLKLLNTFKGCEKVETKKRTLNVEELDEDMKLQVAKGDQMKWFDPREKPFKINGFAWLKNKKQFRRLPEQSETNISDPVDLLANCPAGGQFRFQTNAKKLTVKVSLAGKANMHHMTAVGQCGFDCYIGEPTDQLFCNASRYDHLHQEYEFTFFERHNNDHMNITLNFPLYQGVDQVQVGIDKDAYVAAPPEYDSDKKIIFYGTSITQGGCATRPGMAYTNILSRRFNQEFINLGFSGNGKGEESMARLISEIENPALLVLDYEPNCVSTELYMETLPRFIQTYREVHSEVPILLLSQFPYAAEAIDKYLYEDRLKRLDFQKTLIEQLKQKGDKHIYFYEGKNLLPDYQDECTVDGVHPTDLGFMSIADRLTPILEKILHD